MNVCCPAGLFVAVCLSEPHGEKRRLVDKGLIRARIQYAQPPKKLAFKNLSLKKIEKKQFRLTKTVLKIERG